MAEPKVVDGLAALRVPFPPEAVGKLPRVTCRACSDKRCSEHKPSKCSTCQAYVSPSHIHLDFVGHAETTDRLLSVDPLWTWEPAAWGDDGLPRIVPSADGYGRVLWIRLTVCGVTRLGVGTAGAKADTEKELIGDAIRNAAMRFGVALDLWSKTELESSLTTDDPKPSPKPSVRPQARRAPTDRQQEPSPPATPAARVPSSWVKGMTLPAQEAGVKPGDLAGVAHTVSNGRADSLSGLLVDEVDAAEAAIEALIESAR